MGFRARGIMLVAVLLLSLILVALGLGFLGSRASQYQSSAQSLLAAQARALAWAGIEDARTKLDRDLDFPPSAAQGQTVFTYYEKVQDASGVVVGGYRVAIDTTHAASPYWILGITSTGQLGSPNAWKASHTYRAYLDLSPGSPSFYQIVRWDDVGAL